MTRLFFVFLNTAILILSSIALSHLYRPLGAHFNELSESFKFMVFAVPALGFIFCLLSFVLRWPKISAASFLIYAFIIFGQFWISGKINHGSVTFLLACALLYSLNLDEKLSSNKNRLVLQSAQAVTLAFYFCNGFSKILGYVGFDFGIFFNAVEEHLAYAVAEGSQPYFAGEYLFTHWLVFLKIGWCFAVLIELFAIVVLVKKNLTLRYGCAVILLHGMIGITMGIWFIPSILTLILLFIVSELLIKAELSNNL